MRGFESGGFMELSLRERGMHVWNEAPRAAGVLATAKGFCRTISGKLSIKTSIFYIQAVGLIENLLEPANWPKGVA